MKVKRKAQFLARVFELMPFPAKVSVLLSVTKLELYSESSLPDAWRLEKSSATGHGNLRLEAEILSQADVETLQRKVLLQSGLGRNLGSLDIVSAAIQLSAFDGFYEGKCLLRTTPEVLSRLEGDLIEV